MSPYENKPAGTVEGILPAHVIRRLIEEGHILADAPL